MESFGVGCSIIKEVKNVQTNFDIRFINASEGIEESIMPNVEVKCSVANCFFHADGNVCGADKITIDMDYESKYDAEFSDEFGFEERKEEADQSADTCCKTFKNKK